MVTVLAFTILHQLLISDIWFSVIPMLVAGAACGACLAWTYDLLFRPASTSSWVRFIALQAALLLLLGVASVAAFDPVVPMGALIAANEPPTELIRRAMPLTGLFTLAAAAVTSLLWGRTVPKFASCLLTSSVLIGVLGLNVSALGLVEMSTESPLVVGEFLALIVFIMVAYGLVLFAIERRALVQPPPEPAR